MANWPRCIRCQSFAEPFTDMYWHIGETTIRFGNVRPRMEKGVKSWALMEVSSELRGWKVAGF